MFAAVSEGVCHSVQSGKEDRLEQRVIAKKNVEKDE
jgi:hypothetical protein